MKKFESRNKIFISGENCKESYKVAFKHISKLINKNTKIIDIGCGDLSFCNILTKFSDNVTGVDIYPNSSETIKTLTRDLNKDWNIDKKI